MNVRKYLPRLVIAVLVLSMALTAGTGTAAADHEPLDTTDAGGDNCWSEVDSPDGEFHPEHDHFHEASAVCIDL